MATKVQGLDKLSRKLKAIPEAAKKAAAVALVDGAHDIAELQYALAPKVSGALRNSIEVTPPGGTTPPYSQPGGSRKAGPLETIITAGNERVRYAHLVEYGTAPHVNAGKFAGSQNPGATAHPFFWPGYRALKKAAGSKVTRAINKAIRKAATDGGTNP